MVGRRLAHYDIVEHLGSGGMGDVYRATDTKLGRSVALKFLRGDVAADPARAARFRREAKALAALNHPHIAAIHGQEEADGQTFLVMEFVPGETLHERIDAGALPLSESLSIATQIAEALEAAHDTGIVHRDLKPANIKVTADGRVKVLDFGLAKAAEETGTLEREDAPDLSTVTRARASSAVVIGTPSYMSPEQAKGLPVDFRTDIFAFGCVLFEMLTGRRAFAGDSAADVVSRVLQREPDWTLLPADLPPAVDRLLRLCLEKDPKRRRQSAGDVRIDLGHALSEPAPPSGVRGWRPAYVVGLAGLVAAITGVAAWAALRGRDAPAPAMRLELSTPHTIDPMHFALSPDGAFLVFAAPGESDGLYRLYLRAMNATEARPLRSTDGARYPFWSPDSRSIGYFADRKLYRVDLAGGPPHALAPATNPLGGAWGNDGTILYAPTTVTPLFRISASGGKPVAATELRSPTQSSHRAPSFLPDGRRFLFYAVATESADSGGLDESGIYLGSLDGGTPKRLTAADSGAEFFPPDRIMFVQDRKLVARRIDLERGELSADPVTVGEPARWFSTSAAGLVAYRSGTAAPRRGVWFDHAGTVLSVGDDVNAPALSRDGRFLAYDRSVDGNRDVWVTDLLRGDRTPVTRHPETDGHPVWSPDGVQIAFESNRGGTFDIWKKPANGGAGAAEEPVVTSPANEWPLDWSSDGRFLLFQRTDENYVSGDLLAVPMTGSDRTPMVIAESEFDERMGNFSPDGRWIAYETDESGRSEVVIKPFPPTGGITRVSTDGGAAPRWSADGREIYFIAPDGTMMSATVSHAASTLTVEKPTALFSTHIIAQTFTFQYVVSRDGRFLVGSREVERASAPPITLLLNWTP
jgi:Tol biopolymer transport system component/tRNA A-37 threonylcarbamoyl transferase component Bud32